MFGWLAKLLEILYGKVIPSYGGSIVLFTVLIMVALLPLTLKGTRSMLALQQLQPELKKLQARYKDDRQKLNEETMRFYQENKISPFGGCLPLFIQMPVFFVLYEVLLGLTRRGPYGADLGSSMACSLGGKASSCVHGVFTDGGFFDPKYLSHTSKLFKDLSGSRVMNSFGLDLSQSAMKSLGVGIGHALPYVVMVLVVVLATWYQQRQIQSRTPANAVNPQTQLTMQIMPIVFGFIYLVVPAGVVVYFLASGLFRIGQQWLVTRTMYAPGTPGHEILARAKAEAEAAGPKPKKSWRELLLPPEEMRPKVGKNAPEKSTGPAAKGGPTRSAAAKGGSAKGGSAKGGSAKGAATKGGSAAAKKSPAGAGSKGAGAGGRADEQARTDKPVAGVGTTAEGAPESARPARSAAAPSRRAPNAAPNSRKNPKKN